jgi:hypothetical protein
MFRTKDKKKSNKKSQEEVFSGVSLLRPVDNEMVQHDTKNESSADLFESNLFSDSSLISDNEEDELFDSVLDDDLMEEHPFKAPELPKKVSKTSLKKSSRTRSAIGLEKRGIKKRIHRPKTRKGITDGEISPIEWSSMSRGEKASALKTYTQIYGKRALACKLRCIREYAQTSMENMEHDLISAHGNATFLALGFEEDNALQKCDKRYQTAFKTMMKTIDKLRNKTVLDLKKFVQHDTWLFWTLEDEVDGFIREVGNQSNDIVRANPPPQPERMINLSIFSRHPSTKSSGGKKKYGDSSSGSHITGSASSTRRTSGGGISSTTGLGSTAGGTQSRSSAGNRGKKSTGLRPVMNEFVDYTCKLSS